MRGRDSIACVFHPNVDVKIFPHAADRHASFFFAGGLDGVDDDVLDRARHLGGIALQRAGVLAQIRFKLDAVLRRHRGHAFHHFADNSRNRNRFVRRGFDAAVALPHREQLAAKPDILFDDLQLLGRVRRLCAIFLFGFLELLRKQLDITPDDRQRVSEVMDELRRGLA